MSRRVIELEGVVVPDEWPGRPAIAVGDGWPIYVGGIFDSELSKEMGNKVRLVLEVVAERATEWKDV